VQDHRLGLDNAACLDFDYCPMCIDRGNQFLEEYGQKVDRVVVFVELLCHCNEPLQHYLENANMPWA